MILLFAFITTILLIQPPPIENSYCTFEYQYQTFSQFKQQEDFKTLKEQTRKAMLKAIEKYKETKKRKLIAKLKRRLKCQKTASLQKKKTYARR